MSAQPSQAPLPGDSSTFGSAYAFPELSEVPELPGVSVATRHVRVAAESKTVHRWVKRAVDLVVAFVLLLLLVPLLVTLALLVRCTSRGPALYRQVRVGKDGREILVRKFRSMRVGAEHERDLLQEMNEVEGGQLFKIRRDPRVTPVGHWLRKFSLDELPQLVNVLFGTMSLVGPRPALPDEVAGYPAEGLVRLSVLPGLTGLWQVSGRSDLSWRQAVALDLYYVEHWSLWLDLRILVRTVPAVLLARGAY